MTRAYSEKCILYTFVLTYLEQGQNQDGSVTCFNNPYIFYVYAGKTFALAKTSKPSDKTIIPAVDFEKNLYSISFVDFNPKFGKTLPL